MKLSLLMYRTAFCGPEKGLFGLCCDETQHSAAQLLLGAGVFGDGLGALRHGVLGKLTGEQEPHGRLHLPAGDGGTLVVVGEAGSLGGNAFENVVHERVHDRHRLTGDTGVGVNLFQHLVDVDGVTLLPLVLLLFLVRLGDVLLGFARFLGGFTTCFGRHYDVNERVGSEINLKKFRFFDMYLFLTVL